MARCATIAPEDTAVNIIALGAANNACEGRLYPTSDTDEIYIGMADGSLIGPLPGAGGGGSSSVPWLITTLDAGGETSMVVRYQGTAPSLGKIANGVYELTVPAGTIIKSFYWLESGATFVTGGLIRLRVVDGDGQLLYGIYQVLQFATGEHVEELLGIIIKQTNPAASTVQTEFPNMASLSGGFLIIGSIL